MLVISQLFAPEMGALPNRLSPLTRHLGAHGHDVYVATGMPNYPRGEVFPAYAGRRFMREELEGATVLRTAYFTTPRNVSKGSQLLSYLSFLPAVLHSGWRAGRVDAVFVTSPPIFPALPAIVLAKLRRAKLLVDLRDLWPDEVVAVGAAREGSLPVRVLRLIERLMYRSADIVTCTTQAFSDTVAERGVGGTSVGCFRTAPTSSSSGRCRAKTRSRRSTTSAIGSWSCTRACSGSSTASRRWWTPRRCCATAKTSSSSSAARGRGERRSRRRSRELGLTNVIFGGERAIEEVPYLLARADVCVTNLLRDAYLGEDRLGEGLRVPGLREARRRRPARGGCARARGIGRRDRRRARRRPSHGGCGPRAARFDPSDARRWARRAGATSRSTIREQRSRRVSRNCWSR